MATQVGSAYVEIGARIHGLERGLKSASSQFEAFGRSADRRSQMVAARFAASGDRIAAIGRKMTTRVTLPMAALGTVAVGAAVKFESAFAGVRKTVDATEGEFKKLERGIRDMSLKIPASAESIAQVAEAAGQLGIENRSILKFTRTMIDLGESTNLSSDQAAQALARLANITQMPQKNFDRLGSTIVALGNNLATTESEITEMGLRIAGAGKQVGLTVPQIMGFAGALSSVGMEAQAGGSAVSRVLLNMQNSAMQGGEKLNAFAKIAGTSAQAFAKQFRTAPAQAVVTFVQGLQRIQKSGGNVVEALKSVGITEIRVRDGLLRLAGAGNLLSDSLSLGSAEWAKNTALTKEAGQRYKTAASQLQILRNRATEIARTFGEALVPFLLAAVNAVSPIADGMRRLAEGFKNLPGPVKTAAGAITAFIVALGPLMWMGGKVAASMGKVALAMGGFKAVSATAGAAAVGVGGMSTAVVAAGPRMLAASRAMGSFAAAGKILVGGLATIGPYAASQAGKMSRLGAASGQAKLGFRQLAGAIPFLANPIGALAVTAGVGAAALLMFGKRTDYAREMSEAMARSVASTGIATRQMNDALSAQGQAVTRVAATTATATTARQKETKAIQAYFDALAAGARAGESEAKFQQRLAGLYRAATNARLGAAQSQAANDNAVRNAVDGVNKLADAGKKELDTAKSRVAAAQNQVRTAQQMGLGARAQAKAQSELQVATAQLGVAESRREGRLKQTLKAQQDTAAAIKKSTMSDAEKAASLEVVNRAINRTRTEIKNLPATKTTKITAENLTQPQIDAVKAALAGIDRFITVTIQAVKKGVGFSAGGIAGFAGGGMVRGPAGRDVIPAMLTRGEVVLTKQQQRMVDRGMSIRDAIRKTGGAFARGGTVGAQLSAAKNVENSRKKALDKAKKSGDKNAIARAQKAYNDAKKARAAVERDQQALRGFAQQAGDAYVAMGLARFDAEAAGRLKEVERTFSGTGDVLGKTFSSVETSLNNDLKSLEANFKGTFTVMGKTATGTFRDFEAASRAAFRAFEIEQRKAQRAMNATFDALTPAEARLKAMNDEAAQGDLSGNLAAAQRELAEATKYGDTEGMLEAQKKLREAERAITISELQKTAEAERALKEQERETAQDDFNADWEERRATLQNALSDEQALLQGQLNDQLEARRVAAEAERALLQQQLDERLAAQQAADAMLRVGREHELQDEAAKMTARTNLLRGNIKDVLNRMRSFSRRLQVQGQSIGDALASGLVAAGEVVRTKAAGLAKVIQDYLKTASPTKRGPMSDLDHWWDGLAPALAQGIDTGAIEGSIATATAQPSLRMSAAAAGSVINLTVTDNTLAGMSRDQADRVASQIKASLDRQIRVAI